MSKAGSYRDLVKANELATKNFLSNNSFSVITETKATDVSFKSTVSGDKTKGLSAVIEPKCECRERNVALEAKASTANTFSAKGTYKNVVDDLNVSLQFEHSVTQEKGHVKETNTFTPGLLFNNKYAHFSADLKVPLGGKLAVSAALHAKPVDNFDVGFKVDYEINGAYSAEAKFLGSGSDVEGAFSLNYPSKVWGLHLWHSLNSSFQWGANLTVPPGDDKKNPNPTINFAESYQFDDLTTLKGKLTAVVDRSDAGDHALRAGLSLQQKVNDNTTVTVGADVNLNHALGVGKKSVGAESSCGFQVNFK